MIRRTTATDLALPFLIVGGVGYLLLRLAYESLPPFQWFTAVPIAVLAGTEIFIARRVRNAVRHDPDAKVMTVFAIARAVALAKASAIVGAAVGGAAAALLLRVLPAAGRTDAAGHDFRVGAAVLLAAGALVAAALVLERAGIDPHRNAGA